MPWITKAIESKKGQTCGNGIRLLARCLTLKPGMPRKAVRLIGHRELGMFEAFKVRSSSIPAEGRCHVNHSQTLFRLSAALTWTLRPSTPANMRSDVDRYDEPDALPNQSLQSLSIVESNTATLTVLPARAKNDLLLDGISDLRGLADVSPGNPEVFWKCL